MTTLKFKTNINCKNCIRSVSPFLDEVEGISKWGVDTQNPNKILSVEAETLTAIAIIEVVEDAGFDIQAI